MNIITWPVPAPSPSASAIVAGMGRKFALFCGVSKFGSPRYRSNGSNSHSRNRTEPNLT